MNRSVLRPARFNIFYLTGYLLGNAKDVSRTASNNPNQDLTHNDKNR